MAASGSTTMAGAATIAAATHPDRPALRFKHGDEWVDVSYRDLARTVDELALGLIDLGIAQGDRVAILSNTRPEWTYANFAIAAAGAITTSIYQTNSTEECGYVLRHSGASAVFVEDCEQLAKVRAIAEDLPGLAAIVVMAPDGDIGDAISLAQLRERSQHREAAELEQRVAAVAPADPFLFVYTSGTTGPPKACVLTHGNYRSVLDMVERRGVVEDRELVYLFLPLAHAFALLIQFVVLDLGGTLAYWERVREKIIPNLIEVKPSSFPSVPRVFEKIYTLATAGAADRAKLDEEIQVGLEVRRLRARGDDVAPDLQAAFDEAEAGLFANVRGLFGGRIRQSITGAAPIAIEILEFFYACGVLVMEGYGMTETSTVAACNVTSDFRFGSVGRPLPGQEIAIADDGEILLSGPNIFHSYHDDPRATEEALRGGWLHTGDLGHQDEDGYLYVTGRKKDIIITAGGKNITPSNLENGLKRSRWISQAVVVGDRRPYLIALIALDAEETGAFAAEHGLTVEDLPRSEAMAAEVQRAVDAVNSEVGPVEQIKRFAILPTDLTQETGELTPSLKVKRGFVATKYGEDVERLYAT